MAVVGTAVKVVMYIASAEVYLTGRVTGSTPFSFPIPASIPSTENTLRTTLSPGPNVMDGHLRIILLPLAKCIRQSTTNHVRNTKTNSRTPHQPSRAKLATETLLPPSSENQVCRAPGSCQTGAVGLETVDVEVGAEEKDGREEHGQRLERAHVLGDDQGCEKGWGKGVLCVRCVSGLDLCFGM